MTQISEIIGLFLFASVKLLLAPSTAVAAGYSFLETFLITFTGATFGVFVFYFLGKWLMMKIGEYFPSKSTPKKKKKKNKLIILTKNKFGAMGVAALMGFISVPLAAIIAARYFKNTTQTVTYLVVSALLWTLTLSYISTFVKESAF